MNNLEKVSYRTVESIYLVYLEREIQRLSQCLKEVKKANETELLLHRRLSLETIVETIRNLPEGYKP